MLLELARWLEQLQGHFGLFQYLTFRAILSALTALALSLWWGPKVIRYLASLKSGGQPIRSDGPQSHFSKKGTPTMGGILIWGTLLFLILAFSILSDIFPDSLFKYLNFLVYLKFHFSFLLLRYLNFLVYTSQFLL